MSNRNQPDHTQYCISQAMQHDRERFLSAMLAPVPVRRALVALIAWNLEIAKVGEIASDEMIGLIRYQWWRDALEEIYSGKPARQHAIVLELAEAIAVYALPKEPFMEVISAREADLDAQPFATMDALDDYARRTGGTFLKLWLHVLGVKDTQAQEAAEHVGAAWALTGGLRACHHLAHLGKLRLPADALQDAGIDAEVLLQEGFTEKMSGAVRAVAEKAVAHLEAARAQREVMPKEAYPPLSLAVQAEDFLQRLQASDYNPAHPKVERGRAIRALKLWWANFRRRY